MEYTEEAILEIKEKYTDIGHVYKELLFKIAELEQKLLNAKSREYLMEGVRRRLKILNRCIHKIFELFPIDRRDLLTNDELTDLAINLHAFFVNISGIFDNLAWVFVYENDLYGSPREGRFGKFDIGLFNEKFQTHLEPNLRDYLKSETMQAWYNEYSKNYRDALAHRIPLYVPPSALNEDDGKRYKQIEEQIHMLDFSLPEAMTKYEQLLEEQRNLGRPCVLFAHSFREGCKYIYFHAQVIADFVTIEEIINKFCDNSFAK